nr:hypothetical protein [Synechococcus sp. UW106]
MDVLAVAPNCSKASVLALTELEWQERRNGNWRAIGRDAVRLGQS